MGTYQTLLNNARKRKAEGMTHEQAMAAAHRDFLLTGVTVERDNNGNALNPIENPTGEQLAQALNDYMPTFKKYAPGYVSPNFTPEQMKQRYDYSKRCLNVMEKIVSEHLQRDIVFETTAERLFGNDFGADVHTKVDQRRWMEQLMRLDNTVEAQQHNERVVALVMLGEARGRNEGALGEQIFRRVRTEALTKAHPEWSEKDVAQHVNNELVNPMGDLLDITEDAMKGGPTREQADAARDAILTGAAERTYPGGLEAAYRTVIGPKSAISWNIANACDDIKFFGGDISKEEQRRRFHPYEMNSSSTHGGVVELTANPFYSILDPAGLVNTGTVGLPKRKNEPQSFNAAQSFGGDIANGLLESRNEIMWAALSRFALDSHQIGGVRDQPNDIGIFTNGRGRTVIIVSDPVTLTNGLRADPHTDLPGRLINEAGYRQKIANLLTESTRNDRFMHSSGPYRDLKRALNAMPKEFPDNPTVEQAKMLEESLAKLNKAAKAYLKRKDDQFEERGTKEGKDDYEKARYAFGKSVLKFTDDLERRVKLVREHTETMAAVLAAEQENAQHPIPGDPELTAFERKMKPEDDRIAEQERQEREAKEAAQRREQERKAQERVQQELERQRKEKSDQQAQRNAGDAITFAMEDFKENQPKAAENKINAMNESLDESEELIGDHAITDAEKKLQGNEPEVGEKLGHFFMQAQWEYGDALMHENPDPMKIKFRAADVLAAKAACEFIKYGEKVDPKIAKSFRDTAESGHFDESITGETVIVGGKVRDLVDGIKMLPQFDDLLNAANPTEPDKFAQALEKTAATIAKTAVLSVQEAQKRWEQRKQEGNNYNGAMYGDDSMEQSIDLAAGSEQSSYDHEQLFNSLFQNAKANDAAKEKQLQNGEPKTAEEQKQKSEQPKVKGGPNI